MVIMVPVVEKKVEGFSNHGRQESREWNCRIRGR